MGKLEHLFSQRAFAATNLSIPDTASCWICLEGRDDEENGPLVRGCACRGDAGYCHVVCLATLAAKKEDDLWNNSSNTDDFDYWELCGLCHEPFTDPIYKDLAIARYERCKELDPRETAMQFCKLRDALDQMGSAFLKYNQPHQAIEFMKRKFDIEKANMFQRENTVEFKWFDNGQFANTCNGLGGCYLQLGQLDDAMETFQKGLDYSSQNSSTRTYLLNSVAEVHARRGNFSEAVMYRRTMLHDRGILCGKNSHSYIEGLFSLGCVLIQDGKSHEGYNMIKESKEKAQRTLGPHHPHVMKCDCLLLNCAIPSDPVEVALNLQISTATINGLKNRTDLNGQTVELRNYNSDTGRYKGLVQNNGQQENIAVKPDNVILKNGTKVVIRGLITASDLNGKHGEVVSFNPNLGRYAIRLSEGDKKQIGVKPENAIAY